MVVVAVAVVVAAIAVALGIGRRKSSSKGKSCRRSACALLGHAVKWAHLQVTGRPSCSVSFISGVPSTTLRVPSTQGAGPDRSSAVRPDRSCGVGTDSSVEVAPATCREEFLSMLFFSHLRPDESPASQQDPIEMRV